MRALLVHLPPCHSASWLAIAQLPSLTSLSLRGAQNVGLPCAQIIAAPDSPLRTSLQSLNLDICLNFPPEALDALQTMMALTYVTIRGTPISPEQVCFVDMGGVFVVVSRLLLRNTDSTFRL